MAGVQTTTYHLPQGILSGLYRADVNADITHN